MRLYKNKMTKYIFSNINNKISFLNINSLNNLKLYNKLININSSYFCSNSNFDNNYTGNFSNIDISNKTNIIKNSSNKNSDKSKINNDDKKSEWFYRYKRNGLIPKHIYINQKNEIQKHLNNIKGTNPEERFVHKENTLSLSLNFIHKKSFDELCNARLEDYHTFSQLKLNNFLLDNLNLLQYDRLSEIQKLSFPIFDKTQYDMIGCDQTGSGKTIAYLVPIINSLLNQSPPKVSSIGFYSEPLCTILVPTRELAIQVNNELKKLTYKSGIVSACLYGGVEYRDQIYSLKDGVDIIVATPGRFKDFLSRGLIKLNMVKYFVLDEADRMLDIGFSKEIDIIMNDYDLTSKNNRRNFMFSATFTKEVKLLCTKYMNEFIAISSNNGKLTVNNKIKQNFIQTKNGYRANLSNLDTKLEALNKVLNSNNSNNNKEDNNEDDQNNARKFNKNKADFKTLIFVKTKSECQNLYNSLKNMGYNNFFINGDVPQKSREHIVKRFENNEASILIATDVASRGIDFKNLDVVINYDMPNNFESYVHRIGRTGRRGKSGLSISFISNDDNLGYINMLTNMLEDSGQYIPEFLYEIKSERLSNGYNNNNRNRNSFNRHDMQRNYTRYNSDNEHRTFNRRSIEDYNRDNKNEIFDNSNKRFNNKNTNNENDDWNF